MWAGKGNEKRPRGEIGILTEVKISITNPNDLDSARPYNRVYLFIDHQGGEYLGCLIFDDATACRQIGGILSRQCGKAIREIGDIDLNHLL